MPAGFASVVMRLLYSVTTPAGVIFPIVWLPLPSSVNHIPVRPSPDLLWLAARSGNQ